MASFLFATINASATNMTSATVIELVVQQWAELSWATLLKSALTILVALVLADILHQRYIASQVGMPYLLNTKEGPALPFLGQALAFLMYRPWDLMTNWHRTYQSPVVGFPLLGATMFSIASPSLLKIVLQSRIAAVKKDVQKIMKPFLSILGTGIVSSEGHSWMKQRVKMSTPLRQDVLEIIPRQTLYAVQRLLKVMDEAAEKGDQVPVGESLRHLTLQVISGSFLSLSAEESDSTFATMYLPIVEEGNNRVWHPYRSVLFILPSFWKYHYNVYRLNNYVSGLIRNRWKLRRQEDTTEGSPGREQDILDRVLHVHEKECRANNDDGTLPVNLDERSVQQFRDEMKTFMLAGHETSAAMMTWALYELMGNDKLMNEVAREGQEIFSKKVDWAKASVDLLPSSENLAKLGFCEATLRVRSQVCSILWIVSYWNYFMYFYVPFCLGLFRKPSGNTMLFLLLRVGQLTIYRWKENIFYPKDLQLLSICKLFTTILQFGPSR